MTLTTNGNFYTNGANSGWSSSSVPITDRSGDSVIVSPLDNNRLRISTGTFYGLTGTVSALTVSGEKTNRDSFYYANHGLTTGNTTAITVDGGGALPTVASGSIAYTTASKHLPTMHKITQDAIAAWQSSNTGKWTNFTVGRSPRSMRQQESASTSNFNYCICSCS